tara:strand:+ start:4146 stop:4835 length:690 start_codon:yes stop_codon:yes gene_type:complete
MEYTYYDISKLVDEKNTLNKTGDTLFNLIFFSDDIQCLNKISVRLNLNKIQVMAKNKTISSVLLDEKNKFYSGEVDVDTMKEVFVELILSLKKSLLIIKHPKKMSIPLPSHGKKSLRRSVRKNVPKKSPSEDPLSILENLNLNEDDSKKDTNCEHDIVSYSVTVKRPRKKKSDDYMETIKEIKKQSKDSLDSLDLNLFKKMKLGGKEAKKTKKVVRKSKSMKKFKSKKN